MMCAQCGHKVTTLTEMAKHKASEHGDWTLWVKLDLPKPAEDRP